MNRLSLVPCLFALLVTPATANDWITIENWDIVPVHVHVRDPSSVAPQFDKALSDFDHGKSGYISSCSQFLQVWLGKAETVYGGRCIRKDEFRSVDEYRSAEILICYDTGMGELAQGPAVSGIDRTAALVQFMIDHCPGG